MANPEHVEIVKKGAEAIDAWRKEHPKERLDLSDADLRKIDLSDAYLREVDLHGADLTGADLSAANLTRADLSAANLPQVKLSGAHLLGADLYGAHLYGADLSRAILNGTNLSEANLRGGDLRGANLLGANLRWANLSWSDLPRANLLGANLRAANLSGANLAEAYVGATNLADVDLSEVRGLESVEHAEPSTVGVDTLFRSKGKIPEVFLRHCGVPDALIQQLPYVFNAMEPIQFYSCFVSYNSADEQFARRLHARLTAEKLRVWFAPEKIRGGRWFDEQIDQAIRVYDRLLLVLSEESMKSTWVRHEIKEARRKERQSGKHVLFPIRLVSIEAIRAWKCIEHDTGEDLAEEVRRYHIPDFTNWKREDDFEKAFADLMRDLRAEDKVEP